MLKILLVLLFIMSVFFLARSFVFFVCAKKNSDVRQVVRNLSIRVVFSALLVALMIILLSTGVLQPNNPFASNQTQQTNNK